MLSASCHAYRYSRNGSPARVSVLLPLLGCVTILLTSGFLVYGFYLIATSVTAHYDQTVCSKCGYDLRGRRTSSICPECGGEFTQAELRIERRPLKMLAGICVVALSGIWLVAGVYLSMILS